LEKPQPFGLRLFSCLSELAMTSQHRCGKFTDPEFAAKLMDTLP